MIDLARLEQLAADIVTQEEWVAPFLALDHPAWDTGEAHAAFDAFHADREALAAMLTPETVAALVRAVRAALGLSVDPFDDAANYQAEKALAAALAPFRGEP